MLQWKMNVKKSRKGSIVNFFTKAATNYKAVLITLIFIHHSYASCLNTA